jgi:hypothetical protein
MTYKITNRELNAIISRAKDNMFGFNTPLFVSGSELEKGQMPTLAMLESTLTFLNSKGLFNESVQIDYTDIILDDCDMPDLEERK